jgi:hypothetical protein
MPFDPSPTLTRTFDANRLNALVNHPAIRPTCGGDGESFIDLSTFLAKPKNHAVVWNHGGFLFEWTAPQTYEVHAMILPEGRGRLAYRKAFHGIQYILSHGAERLWARVAEGHEGLRHYTRAAGFKHCGIDVLDIGFGPVAYDLYQWRKPCPPQ